MQIDVNAASTTGRRTASAARVKQARKHVGPTQLELATALGVRDQTISRWERGAEPCYWPNWLAIVEALNVMLVEQKRPPITPDWTPDDVIEPAARAKILQRFGDEDRPVEAVSNLLPVYSLSAAAGAFGGQEHPELEGYVEVDGLPGSVRKTFAAKVKGHSMEPLLMDGELCVWRWTEGALPNGKVCLIQIRDSIDDDGNAGFTTKRLEVLKGNDTDHLHVKTLKLHPVNPAYQVIAVNTTMGLGVRVVAELVAVLDESGDG